MKRGKPLARGKPPARGKRIAPRSAKQAARAATMRELREGEVGRRWPCEARALIGDALTLLDAGAELLDRRGIAIDSPRTAKLLVDALRACQMDPVDPHHARKAGLGGGDTAANLLALCRPCHDLTEHEPGLCYAVGLLR